MKLFVIDAEKAHKTRQLVYQKDGSAFLKLNKSKTVKIPPTNQYDLTQATMFGLNERLTMAATSPSLTKGGLTLRDAFNKEWEIYSRLSKNYGVYAYYPGKNDLVRFCPKYWHRVVSVASNSKLITDPAGKLSWKEIRDIFDKTTIAVAGCSVGNNIIHTFLMDVRPAGIKIADKGLYKMENINRVRLGYWDMVSSNQLKNKARVTADQIYAIDPFIDVYIYDQGVQPDNVSRFTGGGGKEPSADIVIEEADDPRAKILIRQEARKRGIPLIMASDLGSAVQVDILRYDKNRKLPLTYGRSDKEVYEGLEAFYDNPSDRKSFIRFLDMFIGEDYKQGEFKKILEGKSEIPTSTIAPQLGSTTSLAGALVAETAARLLLGHDYPPRFSVNKCTLKIKIHR